MHGILSSPELTSLRQTEQYYKDRGYDVKYIQYNSLTENPTNKIVRAIEDSKGGDTIVIGHSLGGRYVSTAYHAYSGSNKNVKYYTLNSPWSSSTDTDIVDLKHKDDWSNILAFFNDPMSLVSSRWTDGGHSVSSEQVVV